MKTTERKWSAALFLLRAVQLGLPMTDLEHVTIGMVIDMYSEVANDREEYPDVAGQDDFDAF